MTDTEHSTIFSSNEEEAIAYLDIHFKVKATNNKTNCIHIQ